MPELITAWDEYSVDENREGFVEECEEQLDACQDDVSVSRIIDVEVDVGRIRDILLPPDATVKGHVLTNRGDTERKLEALEFILEGYAAGEDITGPKIAHGIAEARAANDS